MKNLDEMKLLARMARNMGQPDLDLEESIRKEELLNTKFFTAPILKEEVLVEADSIPNDSAKTNIVPDSQDIVQQTMNALSNPKFTKSTLPNLQSKEIDGIRKQLSEVMQKMGTLSWGGGGTGVVRFADLDDHTVPRDINHIELNTAPLTYEPPEGTLAWNNTEDCLDIRQSDGTNLQVGLEQYIKITNWSGSTLLNGTVVAFGGIDDDNPLAVLATANSTFDPIFTIGVMTADVANNNVGRVTVLGKVHDMNTTGSDVSETWNQGDLLWMHPTIPGKMTNIKPTPPNASISIAVVVKKDPSVGVILVRPTLYPRLYYGVFSDIGANDHVASAIDTPTVVHINNTDFSSGHVLGSNNNIIAEYSGLYNYQFSLQVTSLTSSKSDIYIWPRKNGVDVPNSASIFTVNTNNGNIVPSWNFVLPMSAGDSFQLMWAVSDVSLKVKGSTLTSFGPAIPSLILTVTQVAR